MLQCRDIALLWQWVARESLLDIVGYLLAYSTSSTQLDRSPTNAFLLLEPTDPRSWPKGEAPLFLPVKRADTVDNLQVVILCEVEHEAVGHRLDFAQAAFDEHGFLAFVVAGPADMTPQRRSAQSLGRNLRPCLVRPMMMKVVDSGVVIVPLCFGGRCDRVSEHSSRSAHACHYYGQCVAFRQFSAAVGCERHTSAFVVLYKAHFFT